MDETVTIQGTRLLAEGACFRVFGEDVAMGPQCAIPASLIPLLEAWPGRTDAAVELALQLPVDFDIERDMAKNTVKSVTMRCCRITVLHRGHKVGYALRTNEAGLNALSLWRSMWARHHARLRNAH